MSAYKLCLHSQHMWCIGRATSRRPIAGRLWREFRSFYGGVVWCGDLLGCGAV